MKNKILTLLIVSILIITSLTGCNNIKLSNNPPTDAPVTSNGGLVVQKGDYLYFANGYVSTESLKNGDNKYGDIKYSAIYRAKTTNSELSYKTVYNDNNEEEKVLTDVELLIPKVVACENGNFFIFDDYIYYASPTTQKDSTGDSRFDLITFFSCKIDGSKTKKLYAVNAYEEGATFNMIKIDGTLYLEVFDGKGITILTIDGNKVKDTKTIAEGSTLSKVIFPQEETYNASNNIVNENKGYVYYTRSTTDKELETDCNVLCRASLKTCEEEILVKQTGITITLLDYYNKNIFYTVSASNDPNVDSTFIYANSAELIKNNLLNNENCISYLESKNGFYVVKTESFVGKEFVGAIISNDDGLWLVAKNENAKLIGSKTITVLAVDAKYLYAYDSSNKIVVIDIETGNQLDTSLENDKLYFESAINFDICGTYMYYFNTYEGDEETGYYLNRLDIADLTGEGELLGIIDSKYIKTPKEDKED